MSNVIGGLAPRDTATDATSGYQLEGAFGVHALTVEGRTFVYVAGLADNGISVFELGPDGSLTNVQNIQDSPTLELNDVANFASVTVNGVSYLYANSEADDGISVFRVNADGTLTNIQNITDNATLELNGSEGRMTVTTVGTSTFLIATGDDDNGVSVFRVGSDGTLTNTGNVTDAGALELDNAMDAVAATVGGRTFVCVAGEDDNGLSVFELDADGTLTNTCNIGDDATLNLWGASGLTVAVVDSVTYLIASGVYDDGLSVFALDAAGQLTNVFNIADDATRGLDGAQGLTTFTLEGETFLSVSGRDDDAVTVFHVGAGGVLTDVTVAYDDAGLALDGSHYNTVATVDGTAFLIATGYNDSGVSVLELLPPGGTGPNGAPTDITVQGGSVEENSTAGTLVATLGAVDADPGETFTFALTDTSGLFAISGNEIRVADGAVIDYEAATSHTVTITVTDSAGNRYDEDIVIGIEDVDESAPTVIFGTNGNNTLSGTGGPDEIWGRGGSDTLLGLEGNDSLYGEAGADLLDGGSGADRMAGGKANDTYVVDDLGDIVTELSGEGMDTVRTSLSSYSLESVANVEHLTFTGTGSFTGTGNNLANTLTGGTGRDTLRGDAGMDVLKGGAGDDTLEGGAAADTLEGGAGADRFVYTALKESLPGSGQDRIIGFTPGLDRIVLTDIDAEGGASGNQDFEIDTDGSFSMGEIRQTVSGGNLLLEFNTDKDTSPEMAILLEGVTSPLSASDFEL